MLTVLVAATALALPTEMPLDAATAHRGIAIFKPAPCEGYVVLLKDAGEEWMPDAQFGLLSAEDVLQSAILVYLGFDNHSYSVSFDRSSQRVRGGESQSFDTVVNQRFDETFSALNGFGLHEAY